MDKILLSTDIGSDIDDALTLLIMLNHPDIDLRGIYTVNGDVDARCYIAKRMIELADVNIPVGRGTSSPLGAIVSPYSYCEEDLIDDIYIDEEKMEEELGGEILYKPLEDVGIVVDGLGHMASQLSQEEHVVFSIAPMTDIALILRHYPKVASNIKRLYVMGFRLNGDLEHNVRFDSVAAQEVLASNVPITIIPGDLCSRYRMPIDIIEQMQSKVGRHVASMLKAFVGGKVVANYRMDSGLAGFLNNTRMSIETTRGLGEAYEKIEKFKSIFLANVNESTAYLDRENFLNDLYKLANQLENQRYQYLAGTTLAERLRRLMPRDVSISDTYVPYCFLYPDKIKVRKMTVDCDIDGATNILEGGKCDVVVDLDFKHFQGYLREYIR